MGAGAVTPVSSVYAETGVDAQVCLCRCGDTPTPVGALVHECESHPELNPFLQRGTRQHWAIPLPRLEGCCWEVMSEG